MKFDNSRALYERGKRSLAGAVNTNSRISELPWPLFFDRGEGALLYDVDGNVFIDYVMGRGPMIFGHSPSFLLNGVADVMKIGQIFGGQHELEFKVAELAQQMIPCAELVRFMSSGTEAVQLALRIARAFTSRSKVVRFDSQFHGWGENLFYGVSPEYKIGDTISAPVPQAAGLDPGTAADIIALPINDLDVLNRALDENHDQVAAIISSPFPHRPEITPGYFEDVRRICDERGIILIFDEVVTGFRLAPGGGQEYINVTPDLSTFAKAMANGFPVAMVAGKSEMMEIMEDGTVMHGGTVNTNVMCMAAADICLRALMEDDRSVYKRLENSGSKLINGIKERSLKHGIELEVTGPGPFLDVSFANEREIPGYDGLRVNKERALYDEFCIGMLQQGIRLMKGGIGGGSWFVSTAHTDEQIEKTLDAVNTTLESMR